MSDHRSPAAWLADAEHHFTAENGDLEASTAAALLGILSAVVATTHEQKYSDDLRNQLDHAQERLRSLEQRLADLADWHDTKAMKARAYPGHGDHAIATLGKAAQVHEDAASRIRNALSVDLHGEGSEE